MSTQFASAADSNGATKLWFTHEHYVEVDQSGYLLNLCLEGAMGYVIRVSGSPTLAWKIPRLVGDSLRENGYIAYLLQLEADNVRLMESAKCDAVLGCQVALPNPFLTAVHGFIQKDRPQPADLPTQRLFVSFEKGKRLRFCVVDLAGRVSGPRDVIPVEMISQLRQDLFNAGSLYRQSNTSVNPASSQWVPMYMESALEKEPLGWYCGLPSVLYNWASGTLQEAISNGHLEEWDVRKHYELTKRVLTGIVALHDRRLLHGDLRPANIMYMSLPRSPDSYKITDYGSFSAGAPEFYGNPSGGAGLDGKTVLQAIQNARVSAFYAPERRNGFEHEEADRALITRLADGSWLITLGWRRLFEDFRAEAGKIALDDEVLKMAGRPAGAAAVGDGKGAGEEGTGDGDSNRIPLCRGDRIRLREYVFRVEEVVRPAASAEPESETLAKLLEKCTILRCEKDVWKVFNERLIVQSSDFEGEYRSITASGDAPFEISLPKVVELYQWSKATDIYSVGVLLLYILFPRQGRRHRATRRAEQDPESGATHGPAQEASAGSAPRARQSAEDTSERAIEREFFVLLDHLANPLYFKQMWTQVHLVCGQLLMLHDEAVSKGEAPEDFRDKTIEPLAARRIFNIREARAEASAQNPQEKGLYEAVKQAVNNICETTPHARLVLQYTFEWNVGLFILFVHFVFSCLHRQVDVRPVGRANGVVSGHIGEPGGAGGAGPLADLVRPKRDESEQQWLSRVMQSADYPFARDRLDDTTAGGREAKQQSPAQRALERAEVLLDLCSSVYVRKLVARGHDNEIADYEPKSQAEVLLDNTRLKGQVGELTSDRDKLKARLDGVGRIVSGWRVGPFQRWILGQTGKILERVRESLGHVSPSEAARAKALGLQAHRATPVEP